MGFFLLGGTVLGVIVYRFGRDAKICVFGFFIIYLSTYFLIEKHQFGATLTVGCGAIAFVLLKSQLTLPRSRAQVGTFVLGRLVLTRLMKSEYSIRKHLPIVTFEANVAEIMANDGNSNALIASYPDQILLQAQTGHPVVTDMATEFHASYKPSLAPSVQ